MFTKLFLIIVLSVLNQLPTFSDLDFVMMNEVNVNALESNEPGEKIEWVNSISGYSGYIVPGKETSQQLNSSGQYCRDFSSLIRYKDEEFKAIGVACRIEIGKNQIRWEIQSLVTEEGIDVSKQYEEDTYNEDVYRKPEGKNFPYSY